MAKKSKDPADVMLMRQKIFTLLTKGEYELKAVAAALDIADPYDSGDMCEWEAHDVMRTEAVTQIIQMDGERVKSTFKWVMDEAYLIL